MSGLFEVDGRHYPLAQIDRLSEAPEPVGRWKTHTHYLRLSGETEPRVIYRHEAYAILKAPVQLIPAAAGTWLLWVWLDDGKPTVGRNPVVAWALCFDSRMRPVTAAGVDDDDNDPDHSVYVEMPDGTVQSTNSHDDQCFYDDCEAYRLGEGEKLIARRNEQEQGQ